MTDGKRTLVTGGAGFIGQHLVGQLLGQGHRVYCLDDFSTGQDANVAAFLPHPAFTLIRQDVRAPLDLEVDRIFNLASPASPAWYVRDPVGTLTTNVLGTMSMLELARKHGARLLQASTSEVYGDPLQSPQAESYNGNVNPLGPRACYDEGKRCAETLCRDYARQYGTDVRIVRIFNTYGPGMREDDGRVIPEFLRRIRQGRPLPVFGDGLQSRAFCHVDDLLRGMLAVMALDGPCADPINLGVPEGISILDLVSLLERLTGRPLATEHLPALPDDPVTRAPDIRRARALLGWRPQVPLDEGLAGLLGHDLKSLPQNRAALQG